LAVQGRGTHDDGVVEWLSRAAAGNGAIFERATVFLASQVREKPGGVGRRRVGCGRRHRSGPHGARARRADQRPGRRLLRPGQVRDPPVRRDADGTARQASASRTHAVGAGIGPGRPGPVTGTRPRGEARARAAAHVGAATHAPAAALSGAVPRAGTQAVADVDAAAPLALAAAPRVAGPLAVAALRAGLPSPPPLVLAQVG
jgi:hypothetical protein